MGNYRLLLAPIQFGAGVKGKFVDAMQSGTPNVTTACGAEAMQSGLSWNGFIADTDEDFVAKAVTLYKNEPIWRLMNGIRKWILSLLLQMCIFAN